MQHATFKHRLAGLMKKYGWSRVDQLEEIHIRFLEELCNLWPYDLEQHKALKAGRHRDVANIQLDKQPIIDTAKEILFCSVGIRVAKTIEAEKKGKRFQEEIKERCKHDWKYFINNWCWVADPRLLDIGLSAKIPLILYPAQENVLADLEMCRTSRQEALVSKSREAGISWGVCALDVGHWLFTPGFRAIYGSEKEEKVDFSGATEPLFGKMRYIIYSLPKWMRPSTFDKRGGPNDNRRQLVNPDNRSEIIGEAGENIGRSGRSTVVRIDEAQNISTPKALDFALESVTRCRTDIGTIAGMNHFYERRESGAVFVTRIWWYQDPRKNPNWRSGNPDMDCPWRKLTEARNPDKRIIAQEYDQNPAASVEESFIPAEWVQAAVNFDLPAEGERCGGFDVAGSGDNEAIYVTRIGPVILDPQTIPATSPQEATWGAINMAEGDRVELFSYDADGIGDAVVGEFKLLDKPVRFKVNAVHGSAAASEDYIEEENRLAKEKFGNRRAELWWQVRRRFEKTWLHRNGKAAFPADEMIAIPNNHRLIVQFSQPQRKYRGAKILVEGKNDMRHRGVKSPDLADAVVYSWADAGTQHKSVSAFDYTQQRNHILDFEPEWEHPTFEKYVVVSMKNDMDVNILCCLWYPRIHNPKLQVYSEYREHQPDLKKTTAMIKDTIADHTTPIKEWIGNDEMFDGMERGETKPWHLWRKAGIFLRRNYSFDFQTSILVVNQMFEAGMLQLHTNCESLSHQLANWAIDGGRAQADRLGLAEALCLLVSRLRRKRAINDKHLKTKAPYNGGARFAAAWEKREDYAPLQTYLRKRDQARAELTHQREMAGAAA